METTQHEVVTILNDWKAAVVAMRAADRAAFAAAQRETERLAAAFLDARYKHGVRVTVTACDGTDYEVLSLHDYRGVLYIVPAHGAERLFQDDANNPRVVTR